LSSEEDRSLVLCIVTSVLLKLSKQRLIDVTSFRLSKSVYCRSVLFKRSNNFGSFFQILWIVEITRPNSRHTLVYFFILYFCNHFNIFIDPQSFVLVNVTMLSSYQSRVNCRGRKVEGNCMLKVNYLDFYYFKACFLCRYLNKLDSFPSQGQGDG